MRTLSLIIAVTILALAEQASADVKPASLFQDNMVLQQGMKVPVWGTASAGEKVTVTFDGQSVSATAGKDGKWKAELGEMKAVKDATPKDLTIAGSNTVTIKNVLVGEVWICAGQSNMEFTLVGANNASDEIAKANYPQIRMFTVTKNPQPAPADSCIGKWAVCSSDTAGNFSAVGYFFARYLHKDLGVPVGMIFTSWGGTLADTWTDIDTLAKLPNHAESVQAFRKATEPLLADKPAYAKKREEAAKQPKAAPLPGSSPAEPSTLFNGMVAPLIPYAIRGVTWYQGEANSSCSNDYYTLFPATIASWRHAWGEGDFPFYYVQIASWLSVQQTPVEISGLAGVRDAQFAAMSVPNTGMASTIDIGDKDSPHPTNKQDVGKRLALWALAKTYGKTGIVYSGPLYKSVKFNSGKAVLSFDCIGGGLVAKGQPLSGFAIAGADKVYHVAKAQIVGDTVVVSSEKVPQPASVRYAFASNPVGNLYNKADLPASPFRTDDWGIESIKSAPGERFAIPAVNK